MPALAAVSDDLSTRFDEAAALARTAGLDGLAVRHVGGVNVAELERDDLVAVRHEADRQGLRIAAVSSPLGRGLTLPASAEALAAAEALLDRMCVAAGILGTDLVRVFAGWRTGREAVATWADRPRDPAGWDAAVDLLSRLAASAHRSGVRLMVELEGASHVGTVQEASDLVAAVGSAAVAICWDVCNGWWSGEEPDGSVLDRALDLPLVDVQFKDVRSLAGDPGRAALEQVVLGEGDIRYAEIAARLIANGYDGWFTAERVYHPRRPEAEPDLRAAILDDVAALAALAGRAGVRA
jgi:sugar phosphate isomerase/epimerase